MPSRVFRYLTSIIVGPYTEDPGKQLRWQALITGSIFAFFGTIGSVTIQLATSGLTFFEKVMALIVAMIAVLIPVVTMRTGSITLGAAIICMMPLVTIPYGVIQKGGIFSPNMSWFAAIPYMMSFLLPPRWAIVGILAVIVEIAALFVIQTTGIIPLGPLVQNTTEQATNYIIEISAMMGFAWIYWRETERYRQRIQETTLTLRRAEEIAEIGSWSSNLAKGTFHPSENLKRILTHPPKDRQSAMEHLASHLSPSELERVMGTIKRAQDHLSTEEIEFEMTKPDGAKGQFKLIYQMEKDRRNGDLRSTGVIQNITETREMMLKLARQSKMTVLGEMAGGIAHEINNPLSIILGKLEQLRAEIERQPQNQIKIHETITKLEETTHRISKIVRGLRAMSRSETGAPFTPTTLATIVENTLELCRERFRHKGIELRIGKLCEVTIECRETQIVQLLLNLLNNSYDAIEAFPEKWVSVDADDRGDAVVIRLTDSGKGIPAETAEKIMTPFFTTKLASKGTGLGLSIGHRIVEEHHGTLALDASAPNTCFVIVLPKCQLKKVA